MLSSKGSTLNHHCQKFNAIYKRCNRLKKSGENEVDLMKRARGIYQDENKNNSFNHEKAWIVLRKHAKWDAPDPSLVDLTEDENVPDEHVFAVNTDELFGPDARPRPPVLEDSQKPLYASCTKFSVLSGVLKLFGLKAKHRWTDASFTDLLEDVHEMLPDGNELPISLYQAKKMMCPTELEVERIHACPNDCILYRDTYANIHRCSICKESRLKRLFANEKDAKLLRWHSDERKKDGKLRHVADSPQWRKINNKHDEFGGEIRNIRFSLSSDGINPFGNMSSKHSTWPVLLCVYNIPPWLCMKRKYIMMSLLIEGPKQPGNDIYVYLAPLIDDLKTL
nr:hypothetical protein [Tanacetum cinerariifolium]